MGRERGPQPTGGFRTKINDGGGGMTIRFASFVFMGRRGGTDTSLLNFSWFSQIIFFADLMSLKYNTYLTVLDQMLVTPQNSCILALKIIWSDIVIPIV